MHIDLDAIMQMNKIHRVNLINSITGFKSANLIGTKSPEGILNLAVFSSVVHIGSNPPFLGLVMRPVTVPRHTYTNLRESGHFTINHVQADSYKQAHQTSAKYEESTSEFEQCGYTPIFSQELKAPYVKESQIRIGLQFEEEHLIKANDTLLIVGKILEIFVPSQYFSADGFVDLEGAGSIAISGLDRYHTTNHLDRLAFARPGQQPKSLNQNS
mgnify:CR=1 FL=1